MAPNSATSDITCWQCFEHHRSVLPPNMLFTPWSQFLPSSPPFSFYLLYILKVTPFVIFCNNLFSLFGQITFFLFLQNILLQPFLPHGLSSAVCPHLSSSLFHLFLTLPEYFIYLGLVLLGFFVLLFSLDFKIASIARVFSFFLSLLLLCAVFCVH